MMPPHRDVRGWWWTVSTGVLVAVAAAFLTTLLAATSTARLAYDFHAGYLPAAEKIRSGISPYTPDPSAELGYPYPPALAELVVPLTFLPQSAASFVAFLVSAATLAGALAIVGVRDVRCYAALVIWAPAWNALEMANVTAVLALGVALTWRHRDNLWASAGVSGFVFSLKLFLWPLLVWMGASRRVPAALLAVAVALVITIASWAVIGFAGFASFPDELRRIPYLESYSFVGIANEAGWDTSVGRLLTALAGGALLVLVVVLARQGDDISAFACAVGAALALSPVVWLHYLALLAVPLGVARPRFSAIWLLPIVLWVCPRGGNGDGLQPVVPALVTTVVLLAIVLRSEEPPVPAEAT
jgi:hypothetical protein